ncbi:MAG: type II toxin-antitoxin system VapC family toxin [bacterium]|nr:type II toxin-antitoxin system VapC family toxin [bacterium]
MIVLDTNVLTEVMRSRPDPAVVRWLDGQSAHSVWTTAVTVYEVECGLRCLPAGRRRSELSRSFRALLAEDLGGRVLGFGVDAAIAAVELAAVRRAAGRPADVRDCQIAGIVASRQAVLATRNAVDFDGACAVVDPWADADAAAE